MCVRHSIDASAVCLTFLKNKLPPSLLSFSMCGSVVDYFLCDFVLFDDDWRVLCFYTPCTVSERIYFVYEFLTFYGCGRNVMALGD